MVTEEDVIKVLEEVYDPELGVDVYSLELIYEINIDGKDLHILMTFTSPACPYGGMLVDEIHERLSDLDGVDEVKVEVTFDPMWQPSEELRAAFGI